MGSLLSAMGAERAASETARLVDVGAERRNEPLPSDRCVSYAGNVTDWAHRNGRVYVLDAWRGDVIRVWQAT